MGTVIIEASKHIAAEPSKIYNVIADYRVGHPAILPKNFFTGLDVIEGGHGAGTKIKVYTKSMGQTRTFNFDVTEPEPGKTLIETDVDSGTSTTFTVEPSGDGAEVTFRTTWHVSGGVAGLFERIFAPPMLRRVYKQELQQLADYVSQN